MAGYFELVDASDGGYRVRMLDGAGSLMAISVTFPTKRAAVAGIEMAREIAGTGLIRDCTSKGAGLVIRNRPDRCPLRRTVRLPGAKRFQRPRELQSGDGPQTDGPAAWRRRRRPV